MGKFKFKINKRTLKYGSNSLLLIVAVLAIVVVVNLLVGMGDFKLDLTSEKIYSISDESKKILKDIPNLKDVTIYGLFDDAKYPSGSEYKELINIVNDFESNGVKVKYIDPDKDPGTIRSLDDASGSKGIAKGDFVVKCGNKVRKLSALDLYGSNSEYGRISKADPLIVGAIKFVTAKTTPVAYFVEGHGEFATTTELKQITQALQNNNLDVKPLSLASEKGVPKDCQVLIFASPKKDLADAEMIKVQEYLKNNGKAIFLFDSLETGDKFTNFEELLAYYNVGINYDKVKEMDENLHLPQDEYALMAVLENNELNSRYKDSKIGLFLPDARSISILKNQKDWLTTTSLAKTSDKSVATDINNPSSTNKGPFDLAIASEIKGAAKILVMGNGQFITDAALNSQLKSYFSNGVDFFLNNVVNWMQDKKDEATVSSKFITPKQLTATESQVKGISVVLIGVIPILIIATGCVVWFRRRHL